MNTLNVGDRVRLLTNREGYDPIRVGSLGTITDPIDADGDYDVLWDERYPGEYDRFAHSSTIERVSDAFKIGDKVRLLKPIGDRREGDVGSVSRIFADTIWPYEVSFAEGLPEVFNETEIEPPPATEPEAPAEKTYGEIIEIALNRFEAAADELRPPDALAALLAPESDHHIESALRVMVGGLVANPRGEKILRKLVGE